MKSKESDIINELNKSYVDDSILKNVTGGGYYGVQTHIEWCPVCKRQTVHNTQNWCIEHKN